MEVSKDKGEMVFTVHISKDQYAQYRLIGEEDYGRCAELIDVVGELDDLIDSPILMSEVATNESPVQNGFMYSTWTFYKLATFNGYVTLRWCGSNDGWYSRAVAWEYLWTLTEEEFIRKQLGWDK